MPFTVGSDTLYVKKVVLHKFFSPNYARIKIGSNDFLPLGKHWL